MDPTDPRTVGALAVVGVALLQLVLARWRDLGPSTATAVGVLLVAVSPGPAQWGAVAAAAGLAAIGWARGGTRGVGHPALVGVAVGCAGVAGAVVALWPHPEVRAAAATSLAVVGGVLQTVALRRAGARRPGTRWIGEVPVR